MQPVIEVEHLLGTDGLVYHRSELSRFGRTRDVLLHAVLSRPAVPPGSKKCSPSTAGMPVGCLVGRPLGQDSDERSMHFSRRYRWRRTRKREVAGCFEALVFARKRSAPPAQPAAFKQRPSSASPEPLSLRHTLCPNLASGATAHKDEAGLTGTPHLAFRVAECRLAGRIDARRDVDPREAPAVLRARPLADGVCTTAGRGGLILNLCRAATAVQVRSWARAR